MSITDELRKYVKTSCQNVVGNSRCSGMKKILAIADSIDREHRMAMEKVAAEVDAPPMTDESMAEHGWIHLPLDADGVPIRVGDRLTDGEYTFNAYELAVYGDGSWSIRNEDGNAWATCDLTHCAQTVEGVLQEFAEKMNENLGMYTSEAIDADEWRDADRQTIAEFAAKLQLRKAVGHE